MKLGDQQKPLSDYTIADLEAALERGALPERLVEIEGREAVEGAIRDLLALMKQHDAWTVGALGEIVGTDEVSEAAHAEARSQFEA